MSKVHVKTGDTVVLLKVKYEDKSTKTGSRRTFKVLEVIKKENNVIVEVNLVTKHMKPAMGQVGGIVWQAPIYASRCSLYA